MTEEMIPEIHLPESAFAEGYSVELGGQRFTQAQWEAVQRYVAGTTAKAVEFEQEVDGHLAQRQNEAFHLAMGIETPNHVRVIPAADVPVVVELIREEFIDELIPALGFSAVFTPEGKFLHLNQVTEPDIVEIYDALIDILYVTYGALNRAGMEAKPGYDEVQGSNMSKLGEDGQAIIAGPDDPDGIFPGRVKKGPNYYKPNLERVLREQGWQDEGLLDDA